MQTIITIIFLVPKVNKIDKLCFFNLRNEGDTNLRMQLRDLTTLLNGILGLFF